jgi:hypothetical protein
LCNEIFCGVSGDTIQVNKLKIDSVSAGNYSQNIIHNGAFDFDVVSFIPDTQFGTLGTASGTLAVITGTVGNDYLEGIAGAGTIYGLETLYGSGGASYSNIAVLNGVTGLDADLMLKNEVFIT